MKTYNKHTYYTERASLIRLEASLELSQTSMMGTFCKNI